MTPAEAVEVLAKKLFQAATDEPWEAASPDQDRHYRAEARAALEARHAATKLAPSH